MADVLLSQIGRIEKGEINPTLSSINAISKALGKDLPSIFQY